MDTDYWHSMDRQFAKNTGLSTDYISVSTHPFKEQLDELKAKIFAGTKNVELSFIATGSGSRAQGQGVPEHYGKEEREELRQLAKVNEIELSVHNPANAPPLSGFSQRGFSPEVKEESLKELKRTIEFAADVARGGSITVHTQEFQRPIFEGGKEFEHFPGEKEKAPLYFVDDRTGQIQGYSRSAEIPSPAKDDKGNVLRNPDGTVQSWENKKIYDLEREAKEKGKEPVNYIFNFIKEKEFEFEKGQAQEVRIKAKKLEDEYKFINRVTKDIEKRAENDIQKAKLMAATWIERLEEGTRERMIPRQGSPEYENFLENPIKYLHEIEKRFENEYKAAYEVADSRQRGVLQIEEEKKHIKPMEEFALKETADTVARAAIYAYQKEKAMKLERPLVISPENVFAQTYGSHPRELKNIIEKSRKEMQTQLLQKGLAKNEKEAEQIAEDRIKATFDIGHVNTWRQYFKGSEKDFNKYILNEVSELNKNGLIGHVHINDNFGYEDIHITPGQGNAPIKEFVDKITEEGFKGKMVIEAGNQRGGEGWQAQTGAYSVLNSPIYRIDGIPNTWTDIKGSYFGRTGVPNYLVGDLAPSKDWTLWSETQLE